MKIIVVTKIGKNGLAKKKSENDAQLVLGRMLHPLLIVMLQVDKNAI